MIWHDWLNQAIIRLFRSDTPRYDAEIILETVTGRSRIHFLMSGTTLLSKEELLYAESLLIRRINGEPIAYLIEKCEFWTLKLKISSNIFIPRPDTECLIEQVLLLDFKEYDSVHVLDLGTGNGAIALSIAAEYSDWHITGIDYQIKAIDLACENATLLKLTNAKFIFSNWFESVEKKKYNLIVSNPPYLDSHDPHLKYGDVRFEPRYALIAHKKGLSDLTHICYHAKNYLKKGGWLILEHGWAQGKNMRQLFMQFGFKHVTTVQDYGCNDRVTYGQL